VANITKKAIVVDTCFLRSMSHRNPGLVELWRQARAQEIDVYIPEIALEEWRTQKVDELMTAIANVERAIRDVWRRNIIAEDVENPHDRMPYPSREIVEAKSRERIERFLVDNKIHRLPFSGQHAQNACVRYFGAQPPFDSAKPREQRRQDLPDAWILEAALELRAKYEVHCLLSIDGDQNLAAAFHKEGLHVHRGLEDILELLQPVSEAPVAPGPAIPVTQSQTEFAARAPDSLSIADVESALSELASSQRRLEVAVLGYVNWFAPISQEGLSELLASRGYDAQAVRVTAERLSLANLLTNTGTHYLPGNVRVCEQAAQAVLGEVVDLLDKL
jgi:hypothetical protein